MKKFFKTFFSSPDFQDFKTIKVKNKCGSESGQSLVESLLAIPIFFLILSGVIFIFYQQLRDVVDDSASISLESTAILFDPEERGLAGWSEQAKDKAKSLQKVADHAINSSRGFSDSTDMKEGVFLDKENVLDKEHLPSSETKPSYSVSLDEENKFQFSTQAQQKSYEKSDFSSDPIFPQWSIIRHVYDGKSLYAPTGSFEWKERPLAVAHASKEFLLTPAGIQFSKEYASLMPGQTQSNFVSNCFMEPLKPNCQLQSLDKKFERAAKDGANTQLLECASEMTAKCLLAGAPQAIAACEVRGIQSILSAIESGQKADVCPILNTVTLTEYQTVKALVYANIIENSANEIGKRTEILGK